MSKKSQILIVGAFPPVDSQVYGGIVTSCRTLLESTFVETFDLVLIDSTQQSNPPPNFPKRAFLAAKRFVRFLRALLFNRPNAVLLFSSAGASLFEKGMMAWVSRVRGVPVFLFPRGAALIDTVRNSIVQRIWVKAAMRGATHILCQGPAWQRFVINVLGFDKKNGPIVLNWTATTSLLKIGAARVLADRTQTPTLLFLGWLEKEKGIFELLEATKMLAERHEFKLIVAGRGHAEQAAKAVVSEYGIQDCVEFVGWVHGAEKDALLGFADIFVLPSWAEGFPNAIIEAMAAKVAVVVTTVGNVPDLMNNRQEALLVAPKNVEALSGAIELLLMDSTSRQRIAEQGYTFARDNFSVETNVAKLAEVIHVAIRESKCA